MAVGRNKTEKFRICKIDEISIIKLCLFHDMQMYKHPLHVPNARYGKSLMKESSDIFTFFRREDQNCSRVLDLILSGRSWYKLKQDVIC